MLSLHQLPRDKIALLCLPAVAPAEIVALAFNQLGGGMRDALDPREPR
ncbi:hypothetical protein JHU04_003148 [Brenneria sp. 4F2]|nr:hypothetical protein [Brenneria bubanii]